MSKTYTIGVLIGNANSPHSMDLMHGIYHAAKKQGVSLLFYLGIHSDAYYHSYFGENAEDDYDYQFNVVYDYTSFGQIDALIISYGTLGQFLERNDKQAFLDRFPGIPYVLLEERDERQRGTSIIADNYHGMYQIVEHLVRDHGYRKLTYLSGPRGNTDAEERLQAVWDVMRTYGIPFDESHIEYGDYTACVEPQIHRLVDRFPDMEAMVCANDLMADTVYRECARRGLVVGHDIAVTGYDDWEVAESMNPPLTTVLQNAYDMGFMALFGALELCRGKAPSTFVVPAQVRLRSSCGCNAAVDHIPELSSWQADGEWEAYARTAVPRCVEKALLASTSKDIRTSVERSLGQILCHDFRDRQNYTEILFRLKALLASSVERHISTYALMNELTDCIDEWMRWQLAHPETNRCDCRDLLELRGQIQQMIMVHIIKADKDRYSLFQQETWFLPLISRDMMNHIDNEKDFYSAAMQKLSALKAKNSYLYIFREPVRHQRGTDWQCPDELYLAASQEGMRVTAYAEDEWPLLSREEGFAAHYAGDRYAMSIFCLFSGEMQYGILVTEIDPSNLALSYLISLQIGNALKFHELSHQQRQTQRKLEQLIKEIREKNEVLNFISEYDVLTGVLNRRGFMERALRLSSANTGKKAVMIFADLDHLKEINDSFGHLEGDFALKSCAEYLRSAAPEGGIIGRIGGDEFVTLVIGGEQESEAIIRRVCEESARFNASSGKDYYVEVSMGCQQIECCEELVIAEVLRKADEALYVAKKRRRASVRKKTW